MHLAVIFKMCYFNSKQIFDINGNNIIQLSNKAELDIANYHEVSDI